MKAWYHSWSINMILHFTFLVLHMIYSGQDLEAQALLSLYIYFTIVPVGCVMKLQVHLIAQRRQRF